MADQPIVYPPLPEDLQAGVSWRSLKYFGAGAIVASVTIASGETIFAARAGALFGYTLLWCFVAGALMKGVQVYVGMRHFVLTGEHPMTHWGYMPGPKNWVPLAIGALSLLCFPFWQAALPLVLGGFMNWICGLDRWLDDTLTLARLWATLAILISVFLLWLQSYKFLERVQTLIVAVLLACVLAAVVAAQPDWFAAVLGIVTPIIPRYDPWILEKYPTISARPPWVEVITCIGAVGGGTYDYVGYVGLLREKAWGAIGARHSPLEVATNEPVIPLSIDTSQANRWAAARWLLPAKVDTTICFLSVLVFTLCFVLLGATLLHPQQLVPADQVLLVHQARFLTDVHPLLLYVYQLGIFMAFFGTIYGAYEVYFRTAYECLMPISGWIRALPFETFRRAMLIYCAALGLGFLWTMRDPVSIITPAALVGGVFTCGLWCLAMLWTDRTFLPRALQMPRMLWLATLVSGIALTSLGLKGIWDYVASWCQ
jgi:hypothetical protein